MKIDKNTFARTAFVTIFNILDENKVFIYN